MDVTDLRKAAEMALEALEWSWGGEPLGTKEFEAIDALRQALAQPEQEPVREHDKVDLRCECCGYMTYHREHLGCIRAAAPPSKPWVSLTYEEIKQAWFDAGDSVIQGFGREIEAALRSKNT